MLILVEKPDVARAFAEAYNAKKVAGSIATYKTEEITIVACRGHLINLAEPEDYDPKFKKWVYEDLPIIPGVIKKKANKDTLKVLKEVQKEISNEKEEIVVATDAGEEGEVIGWYVLQASTIKALKVTRFWESEALTKEVIERGIRARKDLREREKMFKKGDSFKKADWIFGINMSRLLTLKRGELSTIGRVQTVILKEIYKRDMEIRQFIPEDYLELIAECDKGIKAKLVNKGNEETTFTEESVLLKLAHEEIKKERKLIINEIKKEIKVENPPQLFNLTELQKEAHRLYGFNPSKTLEIAQTLYEKEKVLSYPRTPSKVMGEANEDLFINKLRLVEEKIDENKIRGNKRIFNNKELEDHHALIILGIKAKDNTDEYKIWELVKNRMVVQLKDQYKEEKRKIYLSNGGFTYIASDKKIIQQGWKETNEKEEIYQEVTTGECLAVLGVSIKKGKTKPKKHYTYESILQFMENPKNSNEEKLFGIGTTATRHEMMKKLIGRKYITEKGRHLLITDSGEKLVNTIKENQKLDRNTEAEITTIWQRDGNAQPEIILERTKDIVRDVVKEEEGNMAGEEKVTVCKCMCGGNIIEGEKNYYCSNYKAEKKCEISIYKLIHGKSIEKEDVIKMMNKETLGPFEGIKRDGEKVNFGLKIEKDKLIIIYENKNETFGKCPVCSGEMRQGKSNYYCTNYNGNPKCNFVLWKKTLGACFTSEMIKKLLEGSELIDIPCTAENGDTYKANFKIIEGKLGKKTVKVEG